MSQKTAGGIVLAVCLNPAPGLPKQESDQIELLADFGVEGDYHAGKTIRHRYLARKDPGRPNNRQVLLADTKIQERVRGQGIALQPGQLGENILLDGLDLMALEIGTWLEIGPALIELTEVREPCSQLDGVHPGLSQAVIQPGQGSSRYQAGMLGVVRKGGMVRPGDPAGIKSAARSDG